MARYLFVHQNFPGQFRHLARALAARGDTVASLGEEARLKANPPPHPAIQRVGYPAAKGGNPATHPYLRDHEGHIRRGQAVFRACQTLRQRGFRPDVVIAHPGWGEALFLKDAFPNAHHVHYLEYFYQADGGDVGFDPEFPATEDDRLRVRIKNATQLHGLIACDRGISPTPWQKSRYPAIFQDRISVLHEGIDTQRVRPDANAWIQVNGQRLRHGDEVVTYVARNLEPYRGFHTFIRSLPALQARRPNARVVIVGGDEVSYGKRPPEGQSYRQIYCAEVRDQVDWSRVFFVGKVPYADYVRLLQISAAHVYLSYPFVLSWSMLEAMAAGCLVVASNTAPVLDVIRDGENGRLVDFFDPEALAERVADGLARPDEFRGLREAARAAVHDQYDLATRCLPRQIAWLDS